DYTATSGTLTWPDGDLSEKTFIVSFLNSPITVADKTLQVKLTNAIGAAAGTPDTATIVIQYGPGATLSANPPQIKPGESSTLSWTTANSVSVEIQPGIGTVQASGSTTVSPTATTVYTLTATSPRGTTQVQATITVEGTSAGLPPPTITWPAVVSIRD